MDCGDGVFGVAALDRRGRVGGELRDVERGQSQSGDFADSVTALQNLAADSSVHENSKPISHFMASAEGLSENCEGG